MNVSVAGVKICVVSAALSFGVAASGAAIVPSAMTSSDLKTAVQSASSGDTIDLSDFSGTLTVDEIIFPEVSMRIVGPADKSLVVKTSTSQGGSLGHSIFTTTNADVVLTLENLVFSGNVTGGWGGKATETDDRRPGVVRTAGPLVLRNCAFQDNKIIKDEAHGDHFGAANVYSASGLSATECVFAGTYDNRDSYWDYFGAVVLVDGGAVGFTNCVVACNGYTGQSAGNIACFDTTEVSLTGCVFTNNLSQGGSALMTVMNGHVMIKNCIFRNNQSYYGKNNLGIPAHGTVNSSQSTIYGNCGALWFAKGSQNVVVEGCEFSDCSSFGSARGGAIAWRANASGSTLVVANSTFYHCYSADVGGAIECDISYPMYFVNCTFAACGANGNGAAIYHKSARVDMVNTMLAYNYKLNATNLWDWYVQGDRYAYASWVKCVNWTLEKGKCADVHFYADETGSLEGATYGTAKTTVEFASGDPYAEWAESADFPAVVTSSGNFSTDRKVENTSAGPVPVLNSDAKSSRVVEIARCGPLDGKGYYIRHNSDWSAIAYSKDGETWTAMRGSVDDATTLVTADQRGVEYRRGLPPIGAATSIPLAGMRVMLR